MKTTIVVTDLNGNDHYLTKQEIRGIHQGKDFTTVILEKDGNTIKTKKNKDEIEKELTPKKNPYSFDII